MVALRCQRSRPKFLRPGCLWVQKVQNLLHMVQFECPNHFMVSPPLKMHSQNDKVALVGPHNLPKLWGKKPKATTKVTLTSHQQRKHKIKWTWRIWLHQWIATVTPCKLCTNWLDQTPCYRREIICHCDTLQQKNEGTMPCNAHTHSRSLNRQKRKLISSYLSHFLPPNCQML